MAEYDDDINALLHFLDANSIVAADRFPKAIRYYRALTALVAERDKLQSKVNAHAEDRRQYIEAWAHWIEFKSALGIEEWLRVYADAVPAPPPDGDEAKRRIYDHLDQRMRDAADMIAALVAERDELKQRVAELESQPPADRDRDLRERLVCAALTGLCADPSLNGNEVVRAAIGWADEALAAMRKGEANG